MMMSKGYILNTSKALLLLCFVGIFFTSCDEISDERIEVNFKLVYDGAPLVMSGQDIQYPDGTPMIITKSFFYVSNFSLLDGDKTNNKSEVYALDFESLNTSVAEANKGIEIAIPDLGENKAYTGISFDLGIEATRNAMLPEEFEDSHILFNANYWSGWGSYVFSRNEGKLDTDGDGQYESNVSLHLGSDEALRRKELTVDFDHNTEMVNITIDLKELFMSSTGLYDIYTTPTTHSLANSPQVMELSDNLLNCFSVE